MPALIEFSRVDFEYPLSGGEAIPALKDVSVRIEEGERVAVVGANGSGKTTFARLANALLVPKQGTIRVAGMDTREPAFHAAIHAMVGMVFQFPEDQFVATIIEEDVAFGPENLGLKPAEIRQRVEQALREVGLWEYRQRAPHLLSSGQMQRLALAGVLAMRPRCVIFDEATTMLDPGGRKMMLASLNRLHQEGITVVFITHHMEEAVQADRVLAFDHGRLAFDGSPQNLFNDEKKLHELQLEPPPAASLAKRLKALLPNLPDGLLEPEELIAALPYCPTSADSPTSTLPNQSSTEATAVIRVSNLGYTYLKGTPFSHRALDGINLVVPAGSSHVLLGATGSGKTTLLQHLNGLIKPQEGSVRVGPFDFALHSPSRKAVAQVVSLMFQNPEIQFFERYAGDEIAYGPRMIKLNEPLADRVRWAMQMAGLDFETYKDRPLFTLSGGERRKVALASALALKPSILLLDEPTGGLDPRSRVELLSKLTKLRETGVTLAFSSHQIEDAVLLADSAALLNEGRIAMAGSVSTTLDDAQRLEPYGLEAPLAARVAAGLREKGWAIPAGIVRVEDLEASLDLALEACEP